MRLPVDHGLRRRPKARAPHQPTTLPTRLLPSVRLPFPPLPLQQILHVLQVLRRRKVAASVGHVVFQPVGLLVRLIAVRFRASEWLRHEQRTRRPLK